MNNANINLYYYCKNYVFLQNFAWLDIGEFWVWLAKMWHFSYHTSTDISALTKTLNNLFLAQIHTGHTLFICKLVISA